MQQHLTKWGESDNDWERISCAIPSRTIYFREQLKPPKDEIKDKSEAYLQLKQLRNSVTECYISLFSTQYELMQGFSRRFREIPSIDAWKHFENAVLVQAIGYKIFNCPLSDPTLRLELGFALDKEMPSKYDPVEIWDGHNDRSRRH
jgi:hypothetical protein